MKRIGGLSFLFVAVFLLVARATARQPPQFLTPEVGADCTVTFRLWAPNAKAVRVTSIEGQPPADLTKNDQGVWSATIGPLEPEIYSYMYEVDGAPIIDPRNPDVKVWLTLNSMVLVPGTPPRLHEVQDVPHGTVVMHTYRSTSLGQTRQLYVYAPPGYSDKSEPLPVVYLKHGFGDGPSAWTAVGQAHVIADNLIAQHRIQPMLIVMPWGHVISPRLARSRADMENNDKGVERELLEDIIPFIESRYRAAKTADKRAIVGLSMGGGQSLTTGLSHLDTFHWIGGFSSATPEGDLEKAIPEPQGGRRQEARAALVGDRQEGLLAGSQREVQRLVGRSADQTHVGAIRGWSRVAGLAKISGGVPATHLQIGFGLWLWALALGSRRKRP